MQGMTTAPSTSPGSYHHGDLREELLRVGELALEELSVGQVTLREIARRAGVSHVAPRHHFPTLGDLLGEIAARGFERFVSVLELAAASSEQQTAEARLLAMGQAYLAFAHAHPAVYGLMFGKSEQCAPTPHLQQAGNAAWRQLETAVADLVGTQQAMSGALTMWATVHGLAMLLMESRLPPAIANSPAPAHALRAAILGIKASR